ncbi:MAG: DUF58 domain-containing protein [Candidatus Omnitrophica bacterium]|nr:DUF58 domain-containing protein [Candidatus Omnitrophota bacterium]
MIPKEVLKNVRRIEITTKRLVNEVFSGEYKSTFKGRGMEFSEVRQYVVGDDIRSIDWNVTARMNQPFVKKFVEERELSIIFLFDVSASSFFGTRNKFKRELAAEVAALLTFSAIRNNDKVGLIIFSDRIEKFIPPKKTSVHALHVIRDLLYYKPKGKGTDIAAALKYLSKVATKSSIIFLMSDFMDENFRRPLSIASRKHDIIAINVSDPAEDILSSIGLVEVEDLETGRRKVIDTHDKSAVREYNKVRTKQRNSLRDLFGAEDVDYIEMRTDVPYINSLLGFFRKRGKRYRR